MEPQQTPITPPSSPVPDVKSSGVKNSLLVIMAVCLLVATALAGLFYFQIQKLSKQLSQLQAQVQETPAPPATPNKTTGWNLFNGTGYTIQYPPDWYSRSVNNNAVISSYVELSQPVPNVRAKIEIISHNNPEKLSPEGWVADLNSKRQDPDSSVKTQPIAVGDIQAYTRVDNSLDSENTIIYLVYLQRSDKMYSFWVGGDKFSN